jgi:hypothetical protein
VKLVHYPAFVNTSYASRTTTCPVVRSRQWTNALTACRPCSTTPMLPPSLPCWFGAMSATNRMSRSIGPCSLLVTERSSAGHRDDDIHPSQAWLTAHAVVDIEGWLQGKAERGGPVRPYATSVTDHVAADGSNNVAITADIHDMAGLPAMMASPSPEGATAAERHGVIQPATVYIEK